MSNPVVDFLKNSRFLGSLWIDTRNRQLYVLPCEKLDNSSDYTVNFLDIDEQENLEILNNAYVLDNYKYSDYIKKIYKVAIKRTKRQIDSRIKWKVFKKCGFKCFYCGRDGVELTYDHYIPESHGGVTTVENGRAACRRCNETKGNMDPEEWMASDELKAIREREIKLNI